MSVYSMTGFGKSEVVGEAYTITTEIKTVNNRFKDYKFRMSSLFNAFELDLRSRLEQEFRRGSFDVSISYKRSDRAAADFQVDPRKVAAYLDLLRPVFEAGRVGLHPSPTEFLRGEFYKDDDGDRDKELEPLLVRSLEAAVTALKASRAAEGAKLVGKLLEHLAIYESCLAEVEKQKARYPELMREKLTAKLNEKLKDLKIDESRFLQEVVYYLEKLEIDEEINRAKIHVDKLRSVLRSTGEVGRQIDFLLQELGRETNTMGSKSAVPEISSHVVEMKVQLEKIREQALNLE
jgi:uncharacterized protein (TIGR00255 family)